MITVLKYLVTIMLLVNVFSVIAGIANIMNGNQSLPSAMLLGLSLCSLAFVFKMFWEIEEESEE